MAAGVTLTHEVDKHLLLGPAQNKVPVHNPGDAVVIGDIDMSRSFQTRLTHDRRVARVGKQSMQNL